MIEDCDMGEGRKMMWEKRLGLHLYCILMGNVVRQNDAIDHVQVVVISTELCHRPCR